MQQYDLYINAKKPAIGLYVRKGTNLPDLADKADWVFDGSAAQDLLPPSVIEGVAASGHAFRDMDQPVARSGLFFQERGASRFAAIGSDGPNILASRAWRGYDVTCTFARRSMNWRCVANGIERIEYGFKFAASRVPVGRCRAYACGNLPCRDDQSGAIF